MSYPITYWYGIPKDFLSLERLEEAKEAGFNVIECRYDRETNFKVLKWCEELGLRAFVFDDCMYGAVNGSDGWENNLLKMIEEYRDYPALERWFVRDEPTDDLFPALGRVADFLKKNDPEHPVYINLLPLVAVLPAQNYIRHIDNYMKTVAPDLLSYDHYNLMKREAEVRGDLPEAPVSDESRARNHWEDKYFEAWDREGFYDNLEIVRERASWYSVPWMLIILLVEHWHYRKPTEGEIRWEAFTSFAYGSSMLSYFTYWTPGVNHNEPWSYNHGIINSDGERDANYDIVKRINGEVQNVYSATGGAKVEKVYHVGKESDESVKPFEPFGELSRVEAKSLVVGCFDNGMFMAVNKLHHAEQTVTFTLAGGERKMQVLCKKCGKWLDMGNKITLAPGDGELFRIV